MGCHREQATGCADPGKHGEQVRPPLKHVHLNTPPTLPFQAQQRDELLDIPSASGQYITEVALMFVSPDHGVLMQEYQGISSTGMCGRKGGRELHHLGPYVHVKVRLKFVLKPTDDDTKALSSPLGAKGFVGR